MAVASAARDMSAFWSRIVVALAALPVVLGLVWLGGWWLLALGVVVGLVALHEYFTMIRELRPLALSGFAGLVLALVGARLGGLVWMLGGFMSTVATAFLQAGSRAHGRRSKRGDAARCRERCGRVLDVVPFRSYGSPGGFA